MLWIGNLKNILSTLGKKYPVNSPPCFFFLPYFLSSSYSFFLFLKEWFYLVNF